MARTALVTLLMSAGTPMFSGGDEFYRSLHGNNNPYNLDTVANYLPWADAGATPLPKFVQRLLRFRAQHASLRPADFFTGLDANRNGLNDITWYAASGAALTAEDFSSLSGFFAYRVDASEFESGPERSIYVALNADFQSTTVFLPQTAPGYAWYRVVDTAAWFEAQGGFDPEGAETLLSAGTYNMHERSAIVLIERPLTRAR
jgi:glycogen operon protein